MTSMTRATKTHKPYFREGQLAITRSLKAWRGLGTSRRLWLWFHPIWNQRTTDSRASFIHTAHVDEERLFLCFHSVVKCISEAFDFLRSKSYCGGYDKAFWPYELKESGAFDITYVLYLNVGFCFGSN